MGEWEHVVEAGQRQSGICSNEGDSIMTKSVQAVERTCDVMLLVASKPCGIGVSEPVVDLGPPSACRPPQQVHRP